MEQEYDEIDISKELEGSEESETPDPEEPKTDNKSDEGTGDKVEPTSEPAHIVEARSQGWVPLDEWRGDPKEWRDADVFLERGAYFNRMKSQSNEIEKLNKQIKEMARFQKDIAKIERQKAIEELKEQKATALQEEDFKKVVDLDEQITEHQLKANTPEPDPEPTQQQADPYWQEAWTKWEAKNDWYGKDQEKTRYIDSVGLGYMQLNPSATPDEILTYMSQELEVRFPSNNQTPPSPVNSPSQRSSGSPKGKKRTVADLDENQLAMMRSFVSEGVMTEEEYIADLEKIGAFE